MKKVAIIMGSDSDIPKVEGAITTLEKYGIPFEVHIFSAHRTPEEARAVIDRTFYYPPIKHGYVGSICGKACDRACYVHLERKGVLTRKFEGEFRKREVWELPVELT